MKQLFNSIKIIAIALIIGLGVSYVSAAPWAAPGAAPTGGNTVASVNVSDYAQTKIGSFITENFLKAGGAISPTGAPWNKAGYAVAEKAFISPWSFFTSAFLPGNTSQVKIGGGDDATTDIFNAAVTPFTIDLAGRGTGNNSVSGRQVIDIRTDVSECYPNATIRTNTPAVELLNSKTGDNADAIVRGIQLSGGNPAPGKILVSTDANGNAVWGTPTLSGGQIVFTYGTSPAATGQALCSTPPADLCTNISGIQTTVPTGYDHLSNNTCKKWWDVTVMPGNPGESCKDWMTRNGINTNPGEFRVVRKASTTVGLSPILDASTEPSVPTYWVQQVYPNECLYEKSSVQFTTYGPYQYARDTQRAQAENPSVTMAYLNTQKTWVNYQYYLLPRGYRPVATFTQRSVITSSPALYDRIDNLDRSILRQEGVTNLLSGGGSGGLDSNYKMILQEYR